MSEPGFVYALINVSSPGLVKVGKTSKDPVERANELSRATGVATPFVVAFKRLFRDAILAETFVHAFLEAKGYRVAPNREFFSASLEDVIEAILNAPEPIASSELPTPAQDLESSASLETGIDSLSINEPLTAGMAQEADAQIYRFIQGVRRPSMVWDSLFDEADAFYSGHGDTLQDYDAALRLYKRAARLGAIPALFKLGQMYNHGEGCIRDPK